MAVDAAFGDVYLAAAFDLGSKRGSWGEGFNREGDDEARQKNCGGREQFAAAGFDKLRDEDVGHAAKRTKIVAEVLAHADAHRGAEPAADGVEQASLAGSLGDGGSGKRKAG